MNDTMDIGVIENRVHDRGSGPKPATVHYFDHQPGDATRYEMLAVDLHGKGLHLGALGYVGENAVVVVIGMEGRSSAALFKRGATVSEMYVAEHLRLKNEHTIHHISELIGVAIGGPVACYHTP